MTIGWVKLTIESSQDSVHLCVPVEEEGQPWMMSTGISAICFERRFLTNLEITNYIGNPVSLRLCHHNSIFYIGFGDHI